MTDSVEIRIFDTEDAGTVLQCYDAEVADQFDDFLIENLDEEVHFKFNEDSVLFFFGNNNSIPTVQALYNQFQQGRVRKTV